VLVRAERAVDRREVRHERGFGLALRKSRQPAYAVIVADHDLEAAPAVIGGAAELLAPLGCDRALAKVAERVELAAGEVRGRVGRQRGGMDGDREAGLLDQPGRRQPHHARADHGDRPAMPLQAELGRELRAAPAQGDAGAAMAVIVDQPLVPERLGADDEAGGAVRPQARHRPDHPLGRDVDRGQAAGLAHPGARGAGRRATGKSERGARGGEEGAAVHPLSFCSGRRGPVKPSARTGSGATEQS
jgi:hypothetical protein